MRMYVDGRPPARALAHPLAPARAGARHDSFRARPPAAVPLLRVFNVGF
jgi:hypothetical protein